MTGGRSTMLRIVAALALAATVVWALLIIPSGEDRPSRLDRWTTAIPPIAEKAGNVAPIVGTTRTEDAEVPRVSDGERRRARRVADRYVELYLRYITRGPNPDLVRSLAAIMTPQAAEALLGGQPPRGLTKPAPIRFMGMEPTPTGDWKATYMIEDQQEPWATTFLVGYWNRGGSQGGGWVVTDLDPQFD